MRIVIVGGGGQIADALGIQLLLKGHDVSFYHLPSWIHVAGIPKRRAKTPQRLENLSLTVKPTAEPTETAKSRYVWADEPRLRKADLFVFALPSFLAEHSAKYLGRYTQRKPFLNISDRFLGSYAFLLASVEAGYEAPLSVICFGSPPLLAYQQYPTQDTTLFYQKPIVTASCYPRHSRDFMYQIVEAVFGIQARRVRAYESMFHLAMENIQSIVHAVQDLDNLKAGLYDQQRPLYGPQTYTWSIVKRINSIVLERDLIAAAYGIVGLRSLADFDLTTFASTRMKTGGIPSYRHEHSVLSSLPTPEGTKAHGFEDVGWSMVTLESFGQIRGVKHPKLTSLIDDWCGFMGVDYRSVGRTCRSLKIEALAAKQNLLDWL